MSLSSNRTSDKMTLADAPLLTPLMHRHHKRMHVVTIFTSIFLPHSPARNADCLDDADHNLRHEDEEESHKVEGAVGPARREGQTSVVSDAEVKASCQRGKAAHLKAL